MSVDVSKKALLEGALFNDILVEIVRFIFYSGHHGVQFFKKRNIAVFVAIALLLALVSGLSNRALAATTLTTVDSTGNVGTYTSVAIGSDGFARISYRDETNLDLKFVQCTNADCSSKNIVTVDGSGTNVGYYTSLAIGSDGFARISYYGEVGGDLKFVQCTNADCSSKNITTVDNSGSTGSFNSLAIGSDGFARISYYDSVNLDLKFAQCTNASCSSKNITTVDSTDNVGSGTSIVLGSDGFARIAYREYTNYDLKFAQCTNAACTAKNITTVDSGGIVGTAPSIALGSDDFVRISYYDTTNSSLKFAQCTNADCSSKNIATVDNVGDVGDPSSLDLGSDGFARISYYDSTNEDLKFVQCTDASCSTQSITTVDSAGDVGRYNSLALSSGGLPRISYTDQTNADLKFAACSNEGCTPIAAPLSSKSDTLSRVKINALANHEIKFVTANGVAAGQTITITLSSDFSIAGSFDFTDADLAEGDSNNCSTATFTEKTLAGTASGATWGAARTSATVFTFTSGTGTVTADRCVRIRLGTNAVSGTTGDQQITNASTAGSKIITIGGTMLDSGTLAVSIVDDDQVGTTGAVDPIITFDIDTATTDTGSNAPYTVALGTITATDSRVSGTTDGVNFIWIDLDTNAAGGALVTVLNTGGANGLKSTSVPADDISSTDGAIADGTERYGLCVVAVTQTTGTLAKAAPYNTGTCAGNSETNDVQGLTTIGENIISTSSAPIAGGRAQIAVNASIAASQTAHNDYADTLNLIATGTY